MQLLTSLLIVIAPFIWLRVAAIRRQGFIQECDFVQNIDKRQNIYIKLISDHQVLFGTQFHDQIKEKTCSTEELHRFQELVINRQTGTSEFKQKWYSFGNYLVHTKCSDNGAEINGISISSNQREALLNYLTKVTGHA